MRYFRISTIFASLLIMSMGPAFAQEMDSTSVGTRISLHGFMKYIPSLYFRDRADSVFSEGLLHNRLNFRLDKGNGFSIRAGMRNRIFYGEVLKLQPGFGKLMDVDTGLIRLSVRWVDEPGFLFYSSFDRLLVQYDVRNINLTLGRQRINWGINTIWNPNDLF